MAERAANPLMIMDESSMIKALTPPDVRWFTVDWGNEGGDSRSVTQRTGLPPVTWRKLNGGK